MNSKLSTALLISGGVDSSVATKMLIEQGIVPDLFYIAIGPSHDFTGYDCKMEEDIDLCKLVARKFNLNFEIIPLHNEYWNMVVQYHVETLKAGRTPNPDLLCNQLIKFGAFEEKVGFKYDRLATGHYAWIEDTDKGRFLSTAKDEVKDQTYFLAQLNAKQISRLIFPIGQLSKTEVRKIASELNLPNANRKDSQGICFIGRNHYKDFVTHLLGKKKGNFIEITSGKIIGEHDGHWFFTVGQRKGLGLSGGPWFVVKKDAETNNVFIACGYEPEEVYGSEIFVKNPHVLYPFEIKEKEEIEATVKIRHTPTFSNALIRKEANGFYIKTKEMQHGIAPGQFAVVYDMNKKFVLFSGEMEIPD
jgi:tRNA-specific 2-thiouridylase